MWASLGAWIASKAGQLLVIGLAIIGLLCGPLALWQAIEINGVSVFGWTIAHGYKDAEKLYEAEQTQNKKLQHDYDSVSAAAKACSNQTALWKSRADTAAAEFARTLGELSKARAQVDQLSAQILGMKPQGDVCKWSAQLLGSKLGAGP